MKDLKIRVNNEAESKEVQEFLKNKGYSRKYSNFTLHVGWICINEKMDILCVCHSQAGSELNDYKEITLPELRDMVVLKRNDVGDATHYTEECGAKGFLTSDGIEYFWCYALKQWNKHKHSNFMEYQMKPIEKTEMKAKEYLNKETYAYVKTHDLVSKDSNWIGIPDGTDFVTEHTAGTIHFWRKGSYKTNGNNHDWIDMTCHNEKYDAAYWCEISPSNIIWQRHTHPEELPFIDDEPSLNDQYAEIEKVRQTLNQRQEQYGSFEDVAMITEQMVDVMRKGYYENLAYNQKMALYMICSKMARIVNGNPNHKDSWHDIAGYATLIDNELVSEKDMPF